ncbi:sulfotransferase family 2 domain-containing protein [Halalkalibacter urbisdiaboli]|uniref:sulfotransferase family 2 domain-containing protein n=1 Tax=Halalkalibacter urbisdiaboli TaxID=1960589 RepID=UPI000B4504B4|nr:sulfotransferase family 2 domain-containing protein [Halalkalibacter urbisdiaboli]
MNVKEFLKVKLPLYHNDFPLILYWSPKSGCTSLTKWFFFQIGLLEEAEAYHPWIHKYRGKIFLQQQNYKEKLEKHMLNSTKASYKLVRNPYTRAVSSFLHTISNPQLKSEIGVEINEGLSFKQFLYGLKEVGVDIKSINPHFAEQYIKGEENLIQEYIYLEHFNQSIRKIEKQFHLKTSPLNRITKSPHHHSTKMKESGEIVEKKFTRASLRETIPSYDSFYNQETVELVKTLYQNDFKAYGYSQNKRT